MNTKSAEDKASHSGQLNGKIGNVVDKFSDISLKFSALLLLVVILTIWYQVFARIAHISTKGIVELGNYLLVLVCYFGIAYGLRKGRHIRVDIIYGRMPEKIQTIFLIIGNLICVVFSLIIAWEGIKLIRMFYEIAEVSLILHIPMYVVYIAMPIGMILFTIEAIREIVLTVKKGKAAIPTRSLEQEVEQEVEALGDLDIPNK